MFLRWPPPAVLAALLVCLALPSCSSEGGHGHAGSSGHGKSSSHASKPAGHGSSAHGSTASKAANGHSGAIDAAELLELLDIGGQQDPSRYVEVEIGAFRVTHKLADDEQSLVVKFRLVGIVSESKQQRLQQELPNYEKRVRDAVISLVQRAEAEQLAEPGLKWLKAELVAAINRVVHDRALSGIAFSEFSLEAI